MGFHNYTKNQKVIVSYDDSWPYNFCILKTIIGKHIVDYIQGIEHVGSTSIPGMAAKPIIDMDVILNSRDDLAIVTEELNKIGYEHMGDLGIKDREVFKLVRCEFPILDKISHHLYVCPPDSKELARHIKFRDRLRYNKDLRNEYIQLKKSILDRVGWGNRSDYVLEKEKNKEFFDKVLEIQKDTSDKCE